MQKKKGKKSFRYASRKEKVERQRDGKTAQTVRGRHKKCRYEYSQYGMRFSLSNLKKRKE